MGLFQSPQEVGSFSIKGKSLHCHVCNNTRFWQRKAQLNSAAASFFGFDWANKSANCVICDQCGYIHWFMPG